MTVSNVTSWTTPEGHTVTVHGDPQLIVWETLTGYIRVVKVL